MESGDAITGGSFSHWASIAYARGAEQFLHYGVREFLVDFDGCIQQGNMIESVQRSTVLFTSQIAMLENLDPRPVEYLSTVIAEFYEGYIGGSHEAQLFDSANKACANEFDAISTDPDELVGISPCWNSPRLLSFLSAIFHFARRSHDKGQDRFFNMIPAACLILCQVSPFTYRCLIEETLPDTLSALISQEHCKTVQKHAYKALVECLIIGSQYSLQMRTAVREIVELNIETIDGVNTISGLLCQDFMISR